MLTFLRVCIYQHTVFGWLQDRSEAAKDDEVSFASRETSQAAEISSLKNGSELIASLLDEVSLPQDTQQKLVEKLRKATKKTARKQQKSYASLVYSLRRALLEKKHADQDLRAKEMETDTWRHKCQVLEELIQESMEKQEPVPRDKYEQPVVDDMMDGQPPARKAPEGVAHRVALSHLSDRVVEQEAQIKELMAKVEQLETKQLESSHIVIALDSAINMREQQVKELTKKLEATRAEVVQQSTELAEKERILKDVQEQLRRALPRAKLADCLKQQQAEFLEERTRFLLMLPQHQEETQIHRLQTAFRALDADGDGYIVQGDLDFVDIRMNSYSGEPREVREGLFELLSSTSADSDLKQRLGDICGAYNVIDQPETVHFAQFCQFVLRFNPAEKERVRERELIRLFAIFCTLDVDKDGRLTIEDLRAICKLQGKQIKHEGLFTVHQTLQGAESRPVTFAVFQENFSQAVLTRLLDVSSPRPTTSSSISGDASSVATSSDPLQPISSSSILPPGGERVLKYIMEETFDRHGMHTPKCKY